METETAGLKPQPGPQERFLRSSADICFYGGSAGSGKTFGLLLEPLFDVRNPKFRAVIFRRTAPMVRQPGGLLDTSEVYRRFGAVLNQSMMEWTFPGGASLKFSGMETEHDRFGWQGAQLALIAFDEVQEFSENQWWFLFSRLRSTSGAKCRVRCTCNPVADGWLRRLISWWIDDASGFPIKERSGVLRWFVRSGDSLVWADTRQELLESFGPNFSPKSCTFIPALVEDNKILLERDPGYIGNLRALPLVDRARLLDGNWNIRAVAGNFFRREWFDVVDVAPADVVSRCRFWDRASSEQRPGTDPDATASVLMSKTAAGTYFVEHAAKMFHTPYRVDEAILNFAKQDTRFTVVAYTQDPASAGANEAQSTARKLDGFVVKFKPATGSKEIRSRPCSSAAEAGRIKLVRGPWLDELLRELEAFPEGRHDDYVDALVGSYETLCDSSSGALQAHQMPVLREMLQSQSQQGRTGPHRPTFSRNPDRTPVESRFGKEPTPEERGLIQIRRGDR